MLLWQPGFEPGRYKIMRDNRGHPVMTWFRTLYLLTTNLASTNGKLKGPVLQASTIPTYTIPSLANSAIATSSTTQDQYPSRQRSSSTPQDQRP